MEIELTKISEKGQVVIPSSLRKDMGIKKADQFLVFGEAGTVILKKIEKPALQKSLEELTKPLQKVAAEAGFTRGELAKAIKQIRKQNVAAGS